MSRALHVALSALIFLIGCSAPAWAQTNLGTYSVGAVQASLPAPGPYAFDSGTLPPGVHLRTDGPPWWAPGTPAGLVGLATTPGTYAFTLLNNGSPQDYTIKVTALNHKHWNAVDAFVGKPYSFQLEAVGNAGPVTFTQTGGSLPPGLSLVANVVSGTPTTPGFFNLQYSLTDGVDTVFLNLSINVYAVQIETAGVLPNGLQNTTYGPVSLVASGGTPGYSFTSNGMPPGLTLSFAGVISGSTNFVGKRNFNVSVTDSLGASYIKQMSITAVGVPPQLPSISVTTEQLSLGVIFNTSAGVSNGGTAPFTWSATGLPPGMSLRFGEGNTSNWVAAGDVEIWGTPTALGDFMPTITVTDADGKTASKTFALPVRALWLDTGNPPGATYGVPYSHNMRLLGGSNAFTHTMLTGALPLGLTLNSSGTSTLTITGTPLETGGFSFRPQFSDGSILYSRPLSIFVSNPGTTIQINDGPDLGYFTEGSSINRQLNACCLPTYLWTLVGGSLPAGVSLSSSGLLSGIPGAGTTGAYPLLVRVEDPTNAPNFATKQLTLNITNLTLASTLLPNGSVGAGYTQTIPVSGGTGLTFALEPYQYLPPGLALSTDGTISGTPTARGRFIFTVRTVAGSGAVLVRTYTLNVYAAGENPPVDLSFGPNLGSQNMGSGAWQFGPSGFNISGGTPPYTLSFVPGSELANFRLQNGPPFPTFFQTTALGALFGVHTAPGVYSVGVRVTDSLGQTIDRFGSFSVSDGTLLSSQTPPRPTQGTFYSFPLMPYGAAGYSFSATGMPGGLSVNASGEITGTPTGSGGFQPIITVTDLSTLRTSSFTYTLNVNPFAITSGPVLPAGTVSSPYSHTLTAPGCGAPCTWSIVGQSLPGGFSLNGSTGEISATSPTGTANGSFTIQASGPGGISQKTMNLRVHAATPQPVSITTTTLNDSTVGNSVTSGIFVQGGTGPYTVTLDSGALPDGVLIAGPGETLGQTLVPGTTYLIGRPQDVGVYNFVLRATDFLGATTTRAFTWRVTKFNFQYTSVPQTANTAITGGSHTTLVYNTPYSQPLLVQGGNGALTFSTTGVLPTGMTLSASGVISGTPLNTGSFTIPVTVTDSVFDTHVQNVSINIGSGTAVTLGIGLGSNLGTAQLGASQTHNVNPSGGTPGYTLAIIAGALPPGYAINGTQIVGHATTPGSYSFTVRVTDSVGNLAARTYTLTIAPFAIAPGYNTLPDASTGEAYAHALAIIGGTGPTTYALAPGSSLPAGLSLSAAGVLSGTSSTPGQQSFTVNITNNGFTLSQLVTLRTSSIVLTDPTTLPPALYGQPYSYTFTATGGGTGKVFSSTLSGSLSVSSSGVLSGVSNALNAALFTFSVTVTDSSGTLVKRFALPVTSENPSVLDIGVGSTVLADATVNQTVNTTLNANGGVAPYVFSVAPGSSLPPGLALMPAPAGTSSPGLTLLAGAPTTPGSYAFDLIVTDSLGATARRTYSLKVSSIGFVPTSGTVLSTGIAASQLLQGFGGTAPYTFSAVPNNPTQDAVPPGMTLNSGGLLTGTPTSTGNYTARVTVQDAMGATFTRTVTWTVSSGGLLVNSNNPAGLIGRRLNQVLTVTTSNGTPVPPVTWSLLAGSLPPGLFLTDGETVTGDFGTAGLLGQPTAPGTYVYTLRATHTGNPAVFADRTFTARINGMTVGVIQPGALTGTVGSPYSLQLRPAGGVAPYTFALQGTVPLPPGLSLSAAGLISGTPTASGNQVVAWTLTDSIGATQTGQTVVVVTPAGVPAPLQALSTTPTFNDVLVGVPFATYISQWLRGGVAPYTFTLAPGSSLPPGVAIFPGGNGVPDFLGGIPTTVGDYEFDLVVSDSSGQSVTLSFEGQVKDYGATVTVLPTGKVGTPYFLSLGQTGGCTPYYPVVADPTFDLPAGLTISPAGVISGTPTSIGVHALSLEFTDCAGNETHHFYRLAIDSAAGEAPAASLSPNPIDMYYQLGSPAPVVPVSINRTSGTGAFTLNLSNMPWATVSATGGTGPASVNLSVAGSPAAGTYFGVLGATGSATNFPEPVPVRLTVVPAPPCTYSVNPTSASIAAAGASGGFDVLTAGTCAWTAVASDPWISVTAGSSGTGAGAVSYTVAANGAAAARSGSITVNGQVYTISQFGSTCSFAINPVSLGAPASGGVAEVAVTASSACGPADVWTASSAQMTVSPPSGSGSGSVMVTIPSNGAAATQVLTATIAGHTFTVNQAGADCSVALSAPGASYTSAGGSGSVGITTPAGCPYTTVLGPSWISVTSGGSGTGPGSLLYSVEPNSTTFPRSGSLTIGGDIFTITQEALACSATLNTSTLPNPMAVGAGSASVSVTMNGSNCNWTASSGASWATVSPPATTGSGSVLVNVTSNSSSTTGRSTTLTIAGQTVTLNQAGTVCTYGLLSSTGSVPATGGSGTVGVSAPAACSWPSTSNDGWLTITSSSGAGSGSVNFTAEPNTASTSRSGSLTIAGLTFTVNQAAAPCDYTLTPGNITVASGGGSDAFNISTATAGCSPEAVSYASWVHVSTTFGGFAGTVSYTVDPNPSAITRIGIVQVGGKNFKVTQLGAACAYSLSHYGAFFSKLGGSASFLGSPSGIGCTPTVGVDLPTIVTLGTLSGPVLNIFTQEYEVSPFTGVLTPVIRKARISFGGTIFTVKQSSW